MTARKPDEAAEAVAFEPRETENLNAGLLYAQSLIDGVEKDSTNNYSRYNYASAEAIFDLARRALHAAGCFVLADEWANEDLPEYLRDGDLTTGTKLNEIATCMLSVSCEVVHAASGESRQRAVRVPVHVHDGMPLDKAMAAANTLALRYYLRNLLVIPQVESVADVNTRDDTGYQKPKRQPRRQPDPKPKPAEPPAPASGEVVPNRETRDCIDCDESVIAGKGWQRGSRNDRTICNDCLNVRKASQANVPEEFRRRVQECKGCGKYGFDPKGADGAGVCYSCGMTGGQEPPPPEEKAEAAAEPPTEHEPDRPDFAGLVYMKVAGACSHCEEHLHAGEGHKQDRHPETKRVRRWCGSCLEELRGGGSEAE